MPDTDTHSISEAEKGKAAAAVALSVASPMQLVWARFFEKRAAVYALYAVAAIFLCASYAPILASNLAIVWWDEAGLSSPVFMDLFNKATYANFYDLVFNIIAISLPFLLCAGFLLRRKWSLSRRLVVSISTIICLSLLCTIPMIPGKHHMRSLWDNRALDARTHENYLVDQSQDQKVFALFPLIHHSFEETYRDASLKSPTTYNESTQQHFWLGTDVRGRDVVVRMLYGARISLTVGLVATTISLLIGTIFGAISGYFGGWVDLLLQRVVEVMMAFPTLPLLMVVVAMAGREIFIMMIVIGLTSWAGTARLVRGEFLAQMRLDYVLAGRSMGLPGWRIMFRHVLPNISAPLLITATFGIAGSVGAESTLAFIGLGDPNAPSWGELMNQGQQNLSYAWLIYVPGLAIFAIITALNIIGENLRQAMDVKS